LKADSGFGMIGFGVRAAVDRPVASELQFLPFDPVRAARGNKTCCSGSAVSPAHAGLAACREARQSSLDSIDMSRILCRWVHFGQVLAAPPADAAGPFPAARLLHQGDLAEAL